jgi:FkbM family methyltransferase
MSIEATGAAVPPDESSHRSRRLMQAIRIFVFAIPLFSILVVGTALARQWHVLLVISHHLGKRAGICTIAQSFQSVRISEMQASGAERLRRAAHVLQRDRKEFNFWQIAGATYWVPAQSEDAIAYDLAEQERDIYGTGETAVHNGDVVLDCGANVGVFTRKALNAGAKTVIAIEPGPENVECLRRNFSREIAEGRVMVYPKGVWDRDDILELKVDPRDSARDSFVRINESKEHLEVVRVPLTTIDKLTRELNLPRVDFIKMDIEGAEQKAIGGARQTIARYRPRMALCIYHLQPDPVMIPKLVREIVPDYRMQVQCLCAPDRIQPEVAHFY